MVMVRHNPKCKVNICELSEYFFILQYVHITVLTPVSSDPAATLCHRSLNPPRGSVKKPQCEINPFLPQISTLKWVTPLTDSAFSPKYLQADWFSTAIQGLNQQLGVSSIMRAPTATKEYNGNDKDGENFMLFISSQLQVVV